uniref:Uncharacterized protein n=1 Tax=Noccaea caerulescens TaxID=107243 RepID=A0A1J3CMC3_NOCCA
MEFLMQLITGNKKECQHVRPFLIGILENHQKDAACFVKTFRFELVKSPSSIALTASMEILMESITGKKEEC